MVAGTGFEPLRPSGYRFAPVAVVCREPSLQYTLLASLALWATPFEKTVHRTVFSALTQRATLVGLITRQIKKDTVTYPFNLVAGTGFEPRDLRVMSPTSYQTAPPRDIHLSFEYFDSISYFSMFVKLFL